MRRRGRKKLEGLVTARTRELQAEKEKTEVQAEQLRTLDHAKSQFFANLSHEFRTPLTLILGPLDHLLSGNYQGDVRRPYHTMQRHARRLLRLINQLLDLSRLDAGQLHLRTRQSDLIPLVRGLTASFASRAERRQMTLRLHTDLESCLLYYDAEKLETIVINLLSNAFKFTADHGKILVTVKETPPTEKAPDGWVELGVQDTERGIVKEEQDRIFDRFHQAAQGHTRPHEGTGMGLALTKELVLLHHGTIHVESAVDIGSTFTVRLRKGRAHLADMEIVDEAMAGSTDESMDLEAAARREAESVGVLEEAAFSPASHRPLSTPDVPTILVVDDEADVRMLVRDYLGDGFRVLEAADGNEALALAREAMPDLILTDVMMPHLDGYTLCRCLKTDAQLASIPVVMVTAKAAEEDKIAGLETGADDYLVKPFYAPELRALLKNLIATRLSPVGRSSRTTSSTGKVGSGFSACRATGPRVHRRTKSARGKAPTITPAPASK